MSHGPLETFGEFSVRLMNFRGPRVTIGTFRQLVQVVLYLPRIFRDFQGLFVATRTFSCCYKGILLRKSRIEL